MTENSTFMQHIKELLPGVEIEQELGKGATAVVYKAKDPDLKRQYALKVIQHVSKTSKDVFKREKDILLTVNHVNVIKLFQIVEWDSEAALLLEFASGGELFDRIVEKTFYSEHDAANCIKQILQGLKHLHDKGIVHRDLKPENLLYENEKDDSPLKIADFGLGTMVKEGMHKMFTICGTPGYCAPEILCSQGYDEKVDVWSAGVILYILLCGYEPFSEEGGSDKEMFKNILNGRYEFHSPEWDGITEAAKDLVRKMLVVDASKRISVGQALAHPWIVNETSTRELSLVADKLRQLNEKKRKLKMQVHAISAVNAFRLPKKKTEEDLYEGEPEREPEQEVAPESQPEEPVANGIEQEAQ